MMIETFIGMSRYLSPRQDDDWSDRLHYLMTPNILLAFSVLISFKQFGGRPIECMFPNKFPGSWEQYAENYCWSQDTYFVEPKQHVELLKPDQRYTPERELSYYQWVPFFLLLQAAFFRAPSFLWKSFSNHSGIRMHEVVEKAKDSANVEEEVRQKNIAILARHLQNALRFHRRMEKRRVIVHKTVTCLNYQYSSGFVSAVYLFTKALYLVNVVLQLWLMN
ncbi:Innexin [Ancylostoma caninum]|nr:Innexin [Ancylostoma caninum]